MRWYISGALELLYLLCIFEVQSDHKPSKSSARQRVFEVRCFSAACESALGLFLCLVTTAATTALRLGSWRGWWRQRQMLRRAWTTEINTLHHSSDPPVTFWHKSPSSCVLTEVYIDLPYLNKTRNPVHRLNLSVTWGEEETTWKSSWSSVKTKIISLNHLHLASTVYF